MKKGAIKNDDPFAYIFILAKLMIALSLAQAFAVCQ
jgi:hypothetical protein